MSFRASHLKSILDNLGQDEYSRIVNAARYNDQTQLGQLVSEMDPRDFDFAIHFVNKIKERFNNNVGIYKQFLDILSTYRRDKRTIVQIYNKVRELFTSQPDLFEEFQKFLPDPNLGANPVVEEETTQNVNFVTPEEIAFFDRVQAVVGTKEAYNEFLKVVNLYNQDIINKTILVERVAHFLQKSPDLFSWFRTYVKFKPQENVRKIVNQFHIKGITLDHPFTSVNVKQEFNSDMLNLGRKDVQLWHVEGSYRLMPESEKSTPSSGRDPLANSVLNDLWVTHPTWASEDFNVHRKNIYEETLHKTEDDKFELDMKILTNQVAITVFQTLLHDIEQLTELELANHELTKKDFPTTLYRKAIRQIYDEQRGEEMINAVHKKPKIAIPIVLHKLRERHAEWLKDRREFDRVWREAFKQNFWKALDVQGSVLKTQDRKLITPKSCLLEIQELHASKDAKLEYTNIFDENHDIAFDFDKSMLDQVLCLIYDAMQALTTTEYKKFNIAWQNYIIPFFTACELVSDEEKEYLESSGSLSFPIVVPTCMYIVIKLIHSLVVKFVAINEKSNHLIKYPPNSPNPQAIHLNYPCVPNSLKEIEGNRFESFLSMLKDYLLNYKDTSQYEQHCMDCFGLDGHLCFSVDKIVQTIFKTMLAEQHLEEFLEINSKQLNGESYKSEAEKLSTDILFILTVTEKSSVVYAVMIDQKKEDVEEWSNYVDQFLTKSKQDTSGMDIELKNGQLYKLTIFEDYCAQMDMMKLKQLGLEADDLEIFEAEMEKLLERDDVDMAVQWYSIDKVE